MKPTRESILKDIADAVLKNRQATYGPPGNSFTTIAGLWGHYLEARLVRKSDGTAEVQPLMPHDVAAMMMLLKVARIAVNPAHADNWIDAGGYAVCGGELAPPVEQQEMDLQACKTAEPDMQAVPTKWLTEEEQIQASWIGSSILHNSFKTASEFEKALAMDAVLRPSTLTYGQLLDLRQFINRK